MKLLVIVTLIGISAAARLEHLEHQEHLRQYLPPTHNPGYIINHGFGSSSSNFGSFGAHSGTFRSHGVNTGVFGVSRPGQIGPDLSNVFPGVTNAYLPPKPSRYTETPQFAGAVHGFGALNTAYQQYSHQTSLNPFGHHNQYNPQSHNIFAAPSRYQSQPSTLNRQYLTPFSSQNIPQQPFDKNTGYLY